MTHVPWHTDETDVTTGSLKTFLGATMFLVVGNQPRPVQVATFEGGLRLRDLESGQYLFPDQIKGQTIIDALGRGYIIGSPSERGPQRNVGGGFIQPITDYSLGESRALPESMLASLFGGATASDGVIAATQFESERALDLATAKRLGEQTEIDRLALAQAAEQARLEREAKVRSERLAVFNDLLKSFVSSQQSASEVLLQLQPDPFRFAAAAQQMTPLGVTPQKGFESALQSFTARPLPTADPGSLDSINQAIEALTGARIPLSPNTFGLAGGGLVPFAANGGHAAGGQAFLVGEQGPEVMIVDSSGVQILPLQGGFQGGGGVKFDVNTLMQALRPLYGGLGLDRIPTTGISPSGIQAGRNMVLRPEMLALLGVRPRLIQQPGQSAVYYVQDGVLRPVRGATLAQLNPNDILRVGNVNAFGRLGADIPWNELQRISLTPRNEELPPFQAWPTTIREPTTGALLPAPFRVAPRLRQLEATNPFLFDILISAFAKAGIPEPAVRSQIAAATLPGSSRNLIGLV